MQRRAAVEELNAARAELARVRAGNDVDRGYVLSAARAGTASNFNLHVGDHVAAGQPIMTIGPGEGRVVAELDLSDRLATLVKPGQFLRIALIAFPADRYGYLTGRIIRVSPAPTPEHEEAGPRYKALASVDLDSIPEPLSGVRLLDGMPMQAHIALENPTLLTRMTNPRLWFSEP